jgi:hypothetical protein
MSLTSVRIVVVAALITASAGCTSLFMGGSHHDDAALTSATLTKACPLGVPATRVRIADTPSGVDLLFATTNASSVDDLRRRVHDQARAHGPNRRRGSGHDGRHGGYHDHGLQLWSMGPVETQVEETASGARLSVAPVDPGRRDEVRKLVVECVAHLEAQGCDDE